jgi:nitroreductase
MSDSNILNLIRNRGSIRSYKDKIIPQQELLNIIESARLAQSAANRQPWEFILVTNPTIKGKVAEVANHQSFVGEAAAVVVCLADIEKSARVGPFEGFLIDLAIAIENMALTSWDLGIGSCWIGAFNEGRVRELLGIPAHLRVVSLLTLGYPDERPGAKSRKSLNEILHYEKYAGKKD